MHIYIVHQIQILLPFQIVFDESVDLLEVPLGPMTRARAKRFKEALHVLIQDAHVEEARVFNCKKETKMVHIIQLNPDLDQEPRSF